MARFTEQNLKDVLFARAFEPEAESRAGLTRADADAATREARAELARRGADKGGQAFLELRARGICERLDRLHPRLGQWRAGAVWKGPPAWLVLLLGGVLGLVVDRVGPSGNINLLSFPILGLLLWNFAVYLFLLLSPLLQRGRRATQSEGASSRQALDGSLASAMLWLASPRRFWRGAQSRTDHGEFSVNAQRYLRDWLRVAAPLHLVRIKISLHLAALGVMLGAVAGMYLRGLVFHYEASWGSTFLSASAVHGALSFLFSPLESILGQAVPNVSEIEAMGEPGGHGPAAYWIHAWALTGLWAVMIPRTALALFSSGRSLSLSKQLELDVDGDAYFLRLLSSDRGQGSMARVQTYSYQPSARSSEGLTTLLLDLLGGRTRVERLNPREYGEAPILEAASGQSLCQVVLFSLAQSAELEVHGKFLEQTMEKLRALDGQGSLLVVLDEGPFRDRVGDGEEGRTRLLERQRSWKRVLDDAGVEALVCRLDGWSDVEILERARAVLLPLTPSSPIR